MSRRDNHRGYTPLFVEFDELPPVTVYPAPRGFRSHYPILLTRRQIEEYRRLADADPVVGPILRELLASAEVLPEFRIQAPSPEEFRRARLGEWSPPSKPLIPQECR